MITCYIGSSRETYRWLAAGPKPTLGLTDSNSTPQLRPLTSPDSPVSFVLSLRSRIPVLSFCYLVSFLSTGAPEEASE
jgi:hypothetical protein